MAVVGYSSLNVRYSLYSKATGKRALFDDRTLVCVYRGS